MRKVAVERQEVRPTSVTDGGECERAVMAAAIAAGTAATTASDTVSSEALRGAGAAAHQRCTEVADVEDYGRDFVADRELAARHGGARRAYLLKLEHAQAKAKLEGGGILSSPTKSRKKEGGGLSPSPTKSRKKEGGGLSPTKSRKKEEA
ncbi:hypothetical protein Taro_045255 [Colocasia esculenta]|uniref:Uncharacterized protein n=1 Tax=Colocasia esculenta TaxID=4460 RepID=A0A843WZV7_COLES|nr:hypothetical protein [Colocasia esculenta]